jgi:hypothetical protein
LIDYNWISWLLDLVVIPASSSSVVLTNIYMIFDDLFQKKYLKSSLKKSILGLFFQVAERSNKMQQKINNE